MSFDHLAQFIHENNKALRRAMTPLEPIEKLKSFAILYELLEAELNSSNSSTRELLKTQTECSDLIEDFQKQVVLPVIELQAKFQALKDRIGFFLKQLSGSCHICLDTRDRNELDALACGHLFCRDCLCQYISNAIKFPIKCPLPECTILLTQQYIEYFTPQNRALHDRSVKTMLPESLGTEIAISCPNCNTPFYIEKRYNRVLCVQCSQSFCTRCQVIWHDGISCEEYKIISNSSGSQQALNNLAHQEGWRQCPKCQVIVSKATGCNHMICLCGSEFCYSCGKVLDKSHDGNCLENCNCSRNHYSELHPYFKESDVIIL